VASKRAGTVGASAVVIEIASLPLWADAGLFLLAALVITAAGVFMAATADRLADRTGLGEALMGGVLLGGSTSLPGIVASVTAAGTGHPDLAVSNAIGGIAVQTFFLAIADIVYRRANLEHAAASLTNMTQAAVLIALLCLPLVAGLAPPASVAGVHPVTPLIFAGYLLGVRLASQAREHPLWGPTRTVETRLDVPHEPRGGRRTQTALVARFAILAALLGVAGYVTAESGVAIAAGTGLGETVVGALFTAVSTSIPELVTTIAAVRRGALTLAVGGIIGGNTFDMLFIASADVAYREGSIYHAVAAQPYFLMAVTILMTGVLLLGMITRERYGIARIGFESALILIIYVLGIAVTIAVG
jgi:cation:H+ antiporter